MNLFRLPQIPAVIAPQAAIGVAMRRRDFIKGIVIPAAWPLVARAQQPAPPVVTLINARRGDTGALLAVEFRKGLSQTGFVEYRNVIVEYHWLDGHYEAAAAVIDDGVRRNVPA